MRTWPTNIAWWTAIVAVIGFIFPLLQPSRLLRDADSYWHVAAGRWILEHGRIPTQDPFSFSKLGAPWVSHEWLSEVAMALAHMAGGWNGLVILAALASSAVLGLLTHQLLKTFEPIHALIFVVLAAIMLMPHMLARPHMLAAPFQLLWLSALVEARLHNRRPSLILIPLMVLWANLHGGFIVGLIFTALFGAEALFATPGWRARARGPLKQWGLFGALALVASLITPHGVAGLLFPFKLASMSFATSVVAEWLSPNFQKYQPFELWLLLVLACTFRFGLKLPFWRLVMLLLLIHLSLTHQRNIELIGLLAPVFLAHALAPQLAAITRRTPNADGARLKSGGDPFFDRLARRMAWPGLLVFGVLLVGIAALSTIKPITPRDDPITPMAALDALAAYEPPGPVLNAYKYGGYLIYRGIPPFIDGRIDLYGDDFARSFANAINGRPGALQTLLAQYNIGWTLLEPNVAAVGILDLLPNWKRIYTDSNVVIHIRTDTAATAPATGD
jgi:hypothetical protein